MVRLSEFRLSAKQKEEVSKLLGVLEEEQPRIFAALEHLVNVDAWLERDASGKIKTTKVGQRRARELNSIAKGFGDLAQVLSKIDPSVLHHLDDQFSTFQFEMLQCRKSEKTSARSVLPVKELVSKTREWASDSRDKITQEGQGYFHRFFHEVEQFWYWNISKEKKISNAKFSKLVAILLGIPEDHAKKQLKRWEEKRAENPPPPDKTTL